MSESPPNPGEFDDVDEHYRRVTALENGGPSESVRRAVLEHAARLAAERTAAEGVGVGRVGAERAGAERAGMDPKVTDSARNTVVSIGDAKRRTARQTWWRPAALSTLAAAGLAGLLIAPQFLTPNAPEKSASAPVSVAQPPTAAVEPAAPAYSGAPEPGAGESGALALNDVPAANTNAGRAEERMARDMPAAEQNLVKRQMAAAPRKSAAQDELQAEDKASDGAANTQLLGGAKVASGAIASAPALTAAPARALQSAVPMAADRLVDPAAELRHAAGSGDMPALRAALERRPLIEARDADGRTALMLAALHGRGEAVDALLAAGADPNAADARSVTPLQAALGGGQADIAAALRRAGAR